MANAAIKVAVVTRTLENDTFLSEAIMLPGQLLCPDPVYYSDSLRRSRTAAINMARRQLEHSPPAELQGVPMPESPEVIRVAVEVEPPGKTPAWEQPVTLQVDAVRWEHGKSMSIAYVPTLRIAVLAESLDALEKRVVSHVRFAIFREKLAKSLWDIAKLRRAHNTDVELLEVSFPLETAKRRAQRRVREEQEEAAATLKVVGSDLTKSTLGTAYEVDDQVRCVAKALKGTRAGSVLLVGPSGAGKTAIVNEVVRCRHLHGLSNRTFFATSGSRLIAGMGGFGMWQKRCRKICKEASECRAVLHVGGLIELLEVGKSMYNNIGIASFLRPYLLKGDLSIIAECTPEEIPAIEKEDPHLLQAFQRIDINEPDENRARDILLSVALQSAPRSREVITEDAIDLLDRLHRRYATYSAYPGRPIRFLTNLLKDAAPDQPVGTREVLDAFSRESGMPLAILDEDAVLDLKVTCDWFESRVMGQAEAIRQVVDLLAVIKSRLARPRKPLASLLFAGPTGVGKTETAKALAEFLFGDKERLIRFDMSEFADPQGAARLIAGGGDGEGQLTRKVREQPFSVVLLDEFEKAHPATYDLLLQVLGEGRLSDQKGRVADFCNSVIIMTSNLGAASYQKGSIGFADKKDVRAQAREHFAGEVRKFLRPEMFNRIDAIIAFSPLDRETVLAIAKRELSLIQKRDGILLRNVDLLLGDEVAGLLADRGFDPRYGARPIKRAAEEQLVVPLACRLNGYTDKIPLAGTIEVSDLGLKVDISADTDAVRKRQARTVTDHTIRSVADDCASTRRLTRKLKVAGPVVEIQNDIYRLERIEKKSKARMRARKSRYEQPPPELKRLPLLRELAAAVQGINERATELQDDFLLKFYQKAEIDVSVFRQQLAAIRRDMDDLLLRIHRLGFGEPDLAVVGIYGEETAWVVELVAGYARAIEKIPGSAIAAQQVALSHNASTGKRVLVRSDIKDLGKFLREPPPSFVGAILSIKASMAYPMLQTEDGVHTFKDKKKSYKCLVHVSDSAPEDYACPAGVDRVGGFQAARARRTYNCENCRVMDSETKRRLGFDPHNLHVFLGETMQSDLLERARSLIQDGKDG